MPTDGQRMREQFEEWASGAGYNTTRYGDGPFDRYHAVEVNAMWDGYRARDAEVQALEAALTTAQDALLKVGHRLAKVHEDADGAKIALDVHYATQKTEGKATDAD